MKVDCNKISSFAGFIANDLCVFVTNFGRLLFSFFPIVNPIKNMYCNVVKVDQ
jgi:hypothetical protein